MKVSSLPVWRHPTPRSSATNAARRSRPGSAAASPPPGVGRAADVHVHPARRPLLSHGSEADRGLVVQAHTPRHASLFSAILLLGWLVAGCGPPGPVRTDSATPGAGTAAVDPA